MCVPYAAGDGVVYQAVADQLIDLTRRACKLARDNTTDLAASQHRVDAREYTSVRRHDLDRAMLLASPQLAAAPLPVGETGGSKRNAEGDHPAARSAAEEAGDTACAREGQRP